MKATTISSSKRRWMLTTNVDKSTDFNPWADRISLESDIFKKIGGRGKLKDDAFWIGSKAHDASDRIIYNKAMAHCTSTKMALGQRISR